MAKPGRKTRGSLTSQLSSLVGPGRELIPSQLPTNSDLLRLGILLREQADKYSRHYSVNEMAREMLKILLHQWSKANAEFKYPVVLHEETIFLKLKKLWEDGVKVSQGRVKLVEKQKFKDKLDKLLDLLSCKCSIQLC